MENRALMRGKSKPPDDHPRKNSALSATQFVGNAEAADLEDAFILRRPDAQALDARRSGDPVRLRRAHQVARGRAIEMHAQRVACIGARPPQNVLTWLERHGA